MRDADSSGNLSENITLWDFLNELSRGHQLDLLPENVLDEFDEEVFCETEDSVGATHVQNAPLESSSIAHNPIEQSEIASLPIPDKKMDTQGKFSSVGEHQVRIVIPFKGGIRRKYSIQMCVVSKNQELENLRQMELEKAKSEKPQFFLGVRSRQINFEVTDELQEDEISSNAQEGET